MSSTQGRMLGDRYEVTDVIGRGGMAEVREGRDLRLGRRVAIKILRADLARDPAFQVRFRREAQSAAALNHPNIVAVYDTGEDELAAGGSGDDRSIEPVIVPYIVMEYVDGMTLRQLLSRGRRLLPERALEITAGILSALDYAHRHGIVHRDIKPANVMLTRSGDVKVMDFGIARAINDAGTTMTTASAVMGTAAYLSPEQARGEIVDARSDLYSTGVLLYELLTGQPPFTGDSPVAIAYQHVSEMPTPPSQIDPRIPPQIDAIVLHALAKRPDDRYQSAAEFRADIERVLDGGQVTAAVPAVVMDRTAQLTPLEASGSSKGGSRKAPVARRGVGFWIVSLVAIAAAVAGTLLIGRFLFGDTSGNRVQVPNLDGLTIEQAQTELGDFQLTLGAQTPQFSERPSGTIIAQQPAAGELLELGQAVNVTISTGLEESTVPDLVGLTSVEAARVALEDANLVLGTIKERSSGQPAGYVLDQDPSDGTQVPVGSQVSITVASGQVKVPDVVGFDQAQALSDLTQAGFQVQVVEQEDGSVAAGTVLAQAPEAGSVLPRGSVVTITTAVASVVPSNVPTEAPPTFGPTEAPPTQPAPTEPAPTP